MKPPTEVDAPTNARGVTADRLQLALTRLSECTAALSKRTGSSTDLLERVRRQRDATERVTTLSIMLARSRGLGWLHISDLVNLPADALELRMRRVQFDQVTP